MELELRYLSSSITSPLFKVSIMKDVRHTQKERRWHVNTHTVVSLGTPNPQPSGPFSLLPFCAWSVILKQI